MNLLRFNPVFFTVMSAAAVSAFLIPSRFSDRFTPQLQMLFYPVSGPTRAVSQSLAGRTGTDLPPDSRSNVVIRSENQRLIDENLKLKHDLEELASINNERSQLGDLRPL